MASVFVDPAAITMTRAADQRGLQDGMSVLSPGAAEALRHLIDSGYQVAMLGSVPQPIRAIGLPVTAVDDVPTPAPPSSWLVTTDLSACEGRQSSGLKTMLVGPHLPPARTIAVRCDREARDMLAAVMAILAEDASGTPILPTHETETPDGTDLPAGADRGSVMESGSGAEPGATIARRRQHRAARG